MTTGASTCLYGALAVQDDVPRNEGGPRRAPNDRLGASPGGNQLVVPDLRAWLRLHTLDRCFASNNQTACPTLTQFVMNLGCTATKQNDRGYYFDRCGNKQ